MSHTTHRTLCVSGRDGAVLNKLHEELQALGLHLTEIYQSPFNGWGSFFVITSGSKAGWPQDVTHIEMLDRAKEVIAGFKFDDGSSLIRHAFVEYGEFEG